MGQIGLFSVKICITLLTHYGLAAVGAGGIEGLMYIFQFLRSLVCSQFQKNGTKGFWGVCKHYFSPLVCDFFQRPCIILRSYFDI